MIYFSMKSMFLLLSLLQVTLVFSQKQTKPNVTGTCGGNIKNQFGGVIASPGFPDSSYPDESNCTYIIEVEPGNVIAFNSLYMNLEKDCYDYVEIWPEGIITGPGEKYCGEEKVYPESSKGNRLIVRFVSDEGTTNEGFALNWYSLNISNISPTFNCTFDGPVPLCPGWLQGLSISNDTLEWSFSRTATPTRDTGPSSDHTGNEGRFAYLEGSTATAGKRAVLLSPELNLFDLPGFCLSFWYHDYGDETAELEVMMLDNNSRSILFQSEKNSRDEWINENVTLTQMSQPVRIAFTATRGRSFRSDIAIDDVMLYPYPCNDEDASALFKTTATTPAIPSIDGQGGEYTTFGDFPTAAVELPTAGGLCSDNQIPCGVRDDGCVDVEWMCDGTRDCFTDGHDENNCTGWDSWTDWSNCSAPCGLQGSEERRRVCGTGPPGSGKCLGLSQQQRVCFALPCPSSTIESTTEDDIVTTSNIITEQVTTPVPSCPSNMEYRTCASPCNTTCDNKDSPTACTSQCVARCVCPQDHPILHEGRCISPDMCPVNLVAVQNLQIRNITNTSAVVVFADSPTVEDYHIILSSPTALPKPFVFNFNNTKRGSLIYFTIGQLTPGSSYSVRVNSSRGENVASSELVTFETLKDFEASTASTQTTTSDKITVKQTIQQTTTKKISMTTMTEDATQQPPRERSTIVYNQDESTQAILETKPTVLSLTYQATTLPPSTSHTDQSHVSVTTSDTSTTAMNTEPTTAQDPVQYTSRNVLTTQGNAPRLEQDSSTVEDIASLDQSFVPVNSTTVMPGMSSTIPSLKPCDERYQQILQFKRNNPGLQDGPEFPNCTADGFFYELQCSSLTGDCWCVNPQTGERLRGPEGPVSTLDCSDQTKQKSSTESSILISDKMLDSTDSLLASASPTSTVASQNLTCRDFVQNLINLSKNKNPGEGSLFLPECAEDGSYLPRQCNTSSGSCWCVDPKTGSYIIGTNTPAGEELTCPESNRITKSCGGLLSNKSGYLESPNFPQPYYLTQDCNYSVQLFAGSQYLEVYMEAMNLGPRNLDGSCSSDRLQFTEQGGRSFLVCGNSTASSPFVFNSNFNVQLIPGNYQNSKKGFSFRYVSKVCEANGQVFSLSASPCDVTCDNIFPDCTKNVVARCTCPFSKPVLHENQCISISDCVTNTTTVSDTTAVRSSTLDTAISPSTLDTTISPSKPVTPISTSTLGATISPSTLDTTISSSKLDTTISSSTLDTTISSSTLGTTFSSSNLDTKISSSKPDTTISSSNLDTTISSSTLGTTFSSSNLDTKISSSKPDTTISSSNLDTTISSSTPEITMSSSTRDTTVSVPALDAITTDAETTYLQTTIQASKTGTTIMPTFSSKTSSGATYFPSTPFSIPENRKTTNAITTNAMFTEPQETSAVDKNTQTSKNVSLLHVGSTLCARIMHKQAADEYSVAIEDMSIDLNTGVSDKSERVIATTPITYACFHDLVSGDNYSVIVRPVHEGKILDEIGRDSIVFPERKNTNPISYPVSEESKEWQSSFNHWQQQTFNRWFKSMLDYSNSFGNQLPGVSPNPSNCPKVFKPPCLNAPNTLTDYNGCLFFLCSDPPSSGLVTDDDVEAWKEESEIFNNYLMPEWRKLFDAYAELNDSK